MTKIQSAGSGVLFGLLCMGLHGTGCAGGRGALPSGTGEDETPSSLDALMADGDPSTIAPGAMTPAPAVPPPPRFCPSGDCARDPLAFWRLDDCNTASTELADTAFTSTISHPAFRSVSVACVAGISNQAVQIASDDDIVYAPDQPDFQFGQGLTFAAWIKPDRVTGTQSLVRKRLDGTSSFALVIDGRKLSFLLRLTSGRIVNVSTPISAGVFTHVAATYDGQDARLYINGQAAASAHAVGSIAPGAGPIFVGNDANGREMSGIIDEIWLNTLAAPADVINALTCIRAPLVASLTPAQTPPQVAGTTVPFDLSVTNANSASCGTDTVEFFASLPFGLNTDTFFGTLSVAAGQTAHTTVNVRSNKSAGVGSYVFDYELFDESAPGGALTLAEATYVVGTGPVSCDGTPPQTPQIFGSPFGPISQFSLFTYAATGLAAPVVTPVTSPFDGSVQSVQVTVSGASTTDPNAAFEGFGFGFGNPPCLDASAFTGVQFTITGDLGTCQVQVSLVPSENNGVANGPEGVCQPGSGCFGPFSGNVTTGTNVVHFSDMTGGQPLAAGDPSALNDISWNINVPSDGVTAPCNASFTVSDVSFVSN